MTDHGMASPLHWPIGQQRTPSYRRKRNPLWKSATVSTACVQIENEVERMEGRDLVVSTNLALRIDGFPRSGQPEPTDPGAAVYFVRKGKRIALACDRYPTVRENLRAIAMHLDALRGIERWGVGTLDQAFAGYQALPEPGAPRPWWEVLGVRIEELRILDRDTKRQLVNEAWRAAAKRTHPDSGGSEEAFVAAKAAYEKALDYLAEVA